MKETYLKEMETKMRKVARNDEEQDIVTIIIGDILQYMKDEEHEYITTQHVIGMELIFKEWVVKNWMDMQQVQSHRMKKINKIIVKNSIIFYLKAWTQRNEVMYNSEKYQNYIIEWYRRIVEAIKKGDKPNMRTYVERQKLDLEKCNMSYIRL